jgi:phthalate 4,5-dioxygenase oxygenase subunit
MLKPEENERLVRVGPGTPGGAFMRSYWQPALLSSEVAEKDCPPVRVRLLGENLIAFRDTEGRVGLVDAYCPHRLAPLFFGRNEECGIRCVYHGWKFTVDGKCVDMPSEPDGTRLIDKVRLKAYPTYEAGGIVWCYMGDPARKPPPPDYEWLRVPATHRHVTKTFEHCNYLQAMEGGFDTAHSSFVHNNDIGNDKELRNRDRHPRIEVERTDFGYTYSSTRTIDAQQNYVRVYHFVMPHQQLRGAVTDPRGGRAEVPRVEGHLWVPIDDVSTFVYNFSYGYDESAVLTQEFRKKADKFAGRGEDDMIPGTFILKRNPSNDYLIDRELQRTKTYTGIVGLNTQDFALQEGMGPIVDRSKEFLGTSDKAVIMLRRLLLEGIDAVEQGQQPRGVNPEHSRHIRAYDDVVPNGKSWREAFGANLKARW